MSADEYYIEYESQRYGPYDMMSMIRKIRNGQVTHETIVFEAGEDTPLRASDVARFYEVFIELEQEGQEEGPDSKLSLGFKRLFKGAWELLAMNLVASVYTGALLLFVVVFGFAAYATVGEFVGAFLASILGYFLFGLYQMAILRKTRMQLVTGNFFVALVKRSGLQLLIVSAIAGSIIFAVPILLAQITVSPLPLALILIPGSFVMLALFYAPILVADRGIGAFEAIRGSISAIKSLGSDNFITIYMFFLMNYIGASLLLVPLLLTLPMTVAAFCELYDDHLNQFRVV